MCARHGWAFAAYDEAGTLVAAAKGKPPAWAAGIYGAELWGLSMAVSSTDAWAPIRVDCLSVQQGSQRSIAWASDPGRCLAKAWGPVCAALEDNPQRVVWMPAHCSSAAVGVKKLGNGQLLTARDVDANALVDRLAKEAARADQLPCEQREAVREQGLLLTAVATWIGQATRLANHFPDPRRTDTGKQLFLRDSEADARRRVARTPRQRPSCLPVLSAPAAQPRLGTLAGHERWDALHRRIRNKQQDSGSVSLARAGGHSSLAKVRFEHVLEKEGSRRASPSERQMRPSWRGSIPSSCSPPRPSGTAPTRRGESTPGSRVASRPAAVTTELEELRQLEESGLRVVWPSYARERTPAGAACGVVRVSSQAPEDRLQHVQVPCSEMQVALAELAELERCGLQVSWP